MVGWVVLTAQPYKRIIMKKFIIISMAFILVLSLFSCNKIEKNSDKQNLAIQQDIMQYDKFNINTYLKPFWYTREVYNETITFVGENDEAPLMYQADEIVAVKNYGLDVDFKKNKDWVYENGKIKRVSNSSIPYWEIDEYYRTTPSPNITISLDVVRQLQYGFSENRYLMYLEGKPLTDKMISVTYTHSKEWTGPIPQDKSQRFLNSLSKLQSGQKLKILFYGDSITTGCSSSGNVNGGNVSPYCPPYPQLINVYLKNKFTSEITYVNTAVGGKESSWGLANLKERVIDYAPDLVFIAFGMNEGAISGEFHKHYAKEMIDKIHKDLPNTEIIFISTMLPNIESTWLQNHGEFANALLELENEYNFIAVANVTEIHQYLFNIGKRYRDITANNINHPNDFIHRLYAQVTLKTLLGTIFCNEIYL